MGVELVENQIKARLNQTQNLVLSVLGRTVGQSLGAGGTASRLELPGSELLGFTSPCHSPAA